MLEENKVYLLTKHEFLLLAATMGMERVYGFELDTKSLEREDALRILQELTQKKYVQASDNRFVLINEMQVIFRQIKNAETIMNVHKSSGRSCILYIYEEAVKVSQSMRRKDVFEVMLLSKNNIWTHLQEEGWLTEEQNGLEKEVVK